MSHRPFYLIAVLPLLAACAGTQGDYEGPRVSRTMVGDTVVVRTEAGSVWGETRELVPEMSIGEMDGADEYLFGSINGIAVADDGTVYVVDGQAKELRAYDADGRYLGTYGKKGEGPGELNGPDGGIAVLSDGRIVVRDPGNARLQVYNADGSDAGTWPHRGGLHTGSPLWYTDDDAVYPMILLNMEEEGGPKNWQMALVHVDATGTAGDTIRPPDVGYETPSVEAHSPDGSGISMNSVPFSAGEDWTLHPDGYFVHGVETSYHIRLLNPEAPLVIERAVTPVAVTAGEKAEAEARIIHNFRRMDPNWSWNGPGIPDVKPAFENISVGLDGRIWVTVPQPGYEKDDPDYDPKDPDSLENRWHEQAAFDVFEKDGTYLGQVMAPDDFAGHPTPVFRGDQVWAVTRDELGVQRVVRFRVKAPDQP